MRPEEATSPSPSPGPDADLEMEEEDVEARAAVASAAAAAGAVPNLIDIAAVMQQLQVGAGHDAPDSGRTRQHLQLLAWFLQESCGCTGSNGLLLLSCPL